MYPIILDICVVRFTSIAHPPRCIEPVVEDFPTGWENMGKCQVFVVSTGTARVTYGNASHKFSTLG